MRAVVDQSIGMYVLRRLTSRPTAAPMSQGAVDAASLSPDEIAYRLGLEWCRSVGQAPASGRQRSGGRVHSRGPATPTQPVPPRERLARDTGLALAGMLVIGLVPFLVWPAGDPVPESGRH